MKFLMSLILMLIVTTAFAHEGPNIRKDSTSVSGGFSLTKNSGIDDNSLEIEATPQVKQFILDRFAIGLQDLFYWELLPNGNSWTSSFFGPSLTYYFYADDKIASFAEVSFLHQFPTLKTSLKSIMRGSVGLEYFITPEVAVGPTVFYTHYTASRLDFQRYGMTLGLGIYLK